MSKRLEAIEKVLAAGSKDPTHWYMRAMELRSLARHDEALAAFGELEATHGAYVPTYLMAAQLCSELGRTGEARGWAERGQARARAAGDGHALSELTTFLATLGS